MKTARSILRKGGKPAVYVIIGALLVALLSSVGVLAASGGRTAEAGEDVNHGDVSKIHEKEWYLAEGYTGGSFDTWVLVQNPGVEDARVTMEFQLPNGAAAQPYELVVPANTRQSVHLDELPGLSNTEVSTHLTSDKGVFVERSMYFDYDGRKGGTSTGGCACPDFDWLFAEGYTGDSFDTYILVQNPGDRVADVTMEFQLPGGAAEPFRMEVQPKSRRTIKLDELPGLGSTDVSTKISSTQPVIAERSMYFDYYGNDGGHCALGMNSTDQEFFLPEGYTGGSFDTYLLVQNPSKEETKVDVSFLLPDGLQAEQTSFTIPAGERHTLKVDNVPNLSSTDVSMIVYTSVPAVVERAMYFDSEGRDGGSCSQPSDSVSDTWQITEGCTRSGFDTWILVQNPTEETVQATLDFQLADDQSYPAYDLEIEPRGRKTVNLNKLEDFPETDVSTTLRSDQPVVVESSMYFDLEGIKGGHSSLGHIPNMLTPQGVILDSETSALVTSAPEGKVVFSGTSKLLESIEADRVICSDSCKGAPNGFLRKVTEVQKAGNQTTLITEQASIVELIRYGNFFGHGESPAQTGGADVNVPFDLDLGPGDVKGDVDINIGLDVSIHIKWKWKIFPVGFTFKIAASVGEKLALELRATEDFSTKKEVKVKTFDLPKIDAGPLVFFPKVNVYVGFDGSVAAGTDLSCSETTSATLGFGYDGWYTIHDFDADASANASLPYKPMDNKTYVREEIECLLYDVVGPFIDLMEYLRLHSDPDADPWWTLNGGIQSDGGVDINLVLWHLKWSGTIFNKEWQITSAPGKPAIGSITPDPSFIGTQVTIKGSHFGNSRSESWYVDFGGVHAQEYAQWSDDTIVCTVPPGTSGLVPVKVWNSGGLSQPFNFHVQPRIDGINPGSGIVGSKVTISGSAFGASQNGSFVSFGGTKSSTYDSWSDGRIVCRVPEGISGKTRITVGTTGGTSNDAAYSVVPWIDSVDPGSTTVGGQVTINGSGFGSSEGDSSVSFGGVPVTDFTSWSVDKIVCAVPVGSAGQTQIAVTTEGGTSNVIDFKVIPKIDSIGPTSGNVGAQVTINGIGFGSERSDSSVSFGDAAVTDYVSWSDAQVVCLVPAGASGAAEVTLTTGGGTSNGVDFSVVPHLDSIDPSSGPAGTQITFTGSGFGAARGGSYITFGNTGVINYLNWSNNQVVCTVPDSLYGETQVSLSTSGGTSNQLTFGVSPYINTINPKSGGMLNTVNITGTAFGKAQGGSKVLFGTTEASGYLNWNDNSISCVIPEGPTSGTVSVVTDGGKSNGKDFTVLTPIWYLAEGTCAWGFDSYISIENPNDNEVDAEITYMLPQGEAQPQRLTLPAHSQTTVNPKDHLKFETDFSTKVECLDGQMIAVDRTMEWTGAGAPSSEGHNSIGVVAPATTWFLAEGSSAWGFETWLLIQNPNDRDAVCQVTYMPEGSEARTFTKTVPAFSRRTYNMADDMGAVDASIKVTCEMPVIPERSMYRYARREGNCSIGTTLPAQGYYTAMSGKGLSHDCYLAEGSSRWGFTTYLLVQNPNDDVATVDVTYLLEDSAEPQETIMMPPRSRKTIRVNDILPDSDFAIYVHGDIPVAAERSMYWGGGTALGEATHNTVGMTDTHDSFLFPDGEVSRGRETFTCLMNPNLSAVDVTVSYLGADGSVLAVINDTLDPLTRKTYNMVDKIKEGRASILVNVTTPGKRIMAERAMYWNGRGAGTCTIGGFEDRQP